MSGSSYYYSSSSSSSSSRTTRADEAQLPPLRTVLGDQLALPVHGSRYSSAEGLESHTSRGEHGFPSASQYTSYPVSSSTGGYRDSYGHYYPDADMTHSHAQMNREDVKKYICSWEGCGKRFERQNALDTHMNIHTDAKPFACPVCHKVFNVRSNMRRHILTHKEYVDSSADYGDPTYSKSSSSSSQSYYSSR